MSRLSDSQLVVLTAACQRPDRCVFPVTAKLKGNAAGNVLKSLLKKGLIKEVHTKSRDDTVWRHDEQRGGMTLVATKAAFAALGIEAPDADDSEPEVAAEKPANPETKLKLNKRSKEPKAKQHKSNAPRDGSKQAQLIAMLRRAKGASIGEIAEAFTWQPHTVRGAIAGALKKKLGLDVTSEKDDKRGRIYRILD
jgi:hypothetical protein